MPAGGGAADAGALALEAVALAVTMAVLARWRCSLNLDGLALGRLHAQGAVQVVQRHQRHLAALERQKQGLLVVGGVGDFQERELSDAFLQRLESAQRQQPQRGGQRRHLAGQQLFAWELEGHGVDSETGQVKLV